MLLAIAIGNTTGGFAEQTAPEIRVIAAVEPNLVLEGLRIIYDRNKGAA